MPKIYVRCGAPDNRKIRQLARLLSIDPPYALGLCIGLWEKVMVDEHFDAKLPKWDASDIAFACRWTGDPQKLLDSMIQTVILERLRDGTLVAHDWVAEQGELVKKLLRNRNRKKQDQEDVHGGKAEAPVEEPPPVDEVARHLMQQMKLSKIPGSAIIKRERIAAWRARGVKGEDILAAVMNNPGKNIYEIEKVLVGQNGSEHAPGKDSVSKIREKFLSGGSE